jgi:hypothetical protein
MAATAHMQQTQPEKAEAAAAAAVVLALINCPLIQQVVPGFMQWPFMAPEDT